MLTGHYVNYRKQVSPSFKALLPEGEFRLYAVCSRYPSQLAIGANWRKHREGVFECVRGTDVIRVVVLRQLPQTEENAVLHLLSASPELVRFGASHYEQRSAETSTLIYQLFEDFKQEGIAMPYTMKDFRRDFAQEHWKEFLAALPSEKLGEVEEYVTRLKKEETSRKKKKKDKDKDTRK